MEEEKKRDELFLKFKMDEGEKNRQHELQMTRMMMEFMSGRMSNNTPGSFQCPSSSLPPSYPSWPNFQMTNMVSPTRSTLHTPDALTTLRQKVRLLQVICHTIQSQQKISLVGKG